MDSNQQIQGNTQGEQIGYVVGGGLRENLRVRLTVPAQAVQEGAFVVIESGDWSYYGLVTDLQLGATDPRFADEQSEGRLPPELASLLHGQTLFTNLVVLPALMIERGPDLGSAAYESWRGEIDSGLKAEPKPLPVKSVPPHHAPVRLANEGDIAEIFGKSETSGNFIIGYTREQEHAVCLNLDRFVQRSSGVFGATGTGKSFLTRLLLAGLMQYNKASVLVYDMHNEYAFGYNESDTNLEVAGLKDKFPMKVQVAGLGGGTQIQGRGLDFNLEIAESDITPQDIELLTRELSLRDTTPTTLDALVGSFGLDKWFSKFRRMNRNMIESEDGKWLPHPDSVEAWANSTGIHIGAAESLHSKLRRVFGMSYVVEQPAADTVSQIINALEAGKHVVLSFGKHQSDLDYLLVSNLLTRRIRRAWEKKTNAYRSENGPEPRPLVIVLEEAHKLLNREMAGQTTFSTIAREMRKYYVTLLIVDQRPSQIYDEVMSQLGTRISGWLGDDDDIRAVLSGLAGRETLKGMLAHLQEKEEVLLLGWGVPMPLPVCSRRYDKRFWEALQGKGGGRTSGKSREKIMGELGF